jgi:hypothetical protein
MGNDEIFFLDGDETKDTSFEETKSPIKVAFLEKAIFINNHLIKEGTAFEILGK